MTLSQKVLELIEKKGVTAYQVSVKTGVPHSSLSRILGGETTKLSIKNKELLSKYFQVDEDYFNNGNNSKVKKIEHAADFKNQEHTQLSSGVNLAEFELLKLELKHAYDKLENAKEHIKTLNDQIMYLKENGSIFNKELAEKIDFIFLEMKKPVIESKLQLLANLINEKRSEELNNSKDAITNNTIKK